MIRTNRTEHYQIARKYFSLIDNIGQRLRKKPYSVGNEPNSRLTDHFQGLMPLFNSMTSPSPTSRLHDNRPVEEWNPFCQRVLLPDEKIPNMAKFEKDFNLILTRTQTFIEWSHESTHVLALEPFFVGHTKIKSKRHFVEINLANEAFAFWYADIIVTPNIRKIVPKSEFVYLRSAVSNLTFHPKEAFNQLGIKNDKEILKIYVDAFLNKRIQKEFYSNIYFVNLSKRFRTFYNVSTVALENWYSVLVEFDFFEGYFNRFCKIENLPSLFNKTILEKADIQKPDEYAYFLGTRYFSQLEQLTHLDISKVCLRRHIQVRAYFAWFIKKSVEKKWIFGTNGNLKHDSIGRNLDSYLDRLEIILKSLASESSIQQVKVMLKAADGFYLKEIHSEFKRIDAHMKYRYRLFPFFSPTKGRVGLTDDYMVLTRKEMNETVKAIIKDLDWETEFQSNTGPTVSNLLSNFLNAEKNKGHSALKKAFNNLMSHPKVIPLWSVRLSDLNPSLNQFREPVFRYT